MINIYESIIKVQTTQSENFVRDLNSTYTKVQEIKAAQHH